MTSSTIAGHPWLGLTGKAASGKDSLARWLVEDHGYTRVAFADNVRQALVAMDPIVEVDTPPYAQGRGVRLTEVLETMDWTAAKRIPEVRRLLQRLGTESIRALDAGFWVRLGLEKAARVDGPVVFTDVRYQNEAEAIVKAGGLVARVRRENYDRSAGDHVSERMLDSIPASLLVWNDGTLEDLRQEATRVAAFARDFYRTSVTL